MDTKITKTKKFLGAYRGKALKEVDHHKIKLNKMPIVELKDLVMKYGQNTVLNEINMTIFEGEFITILGPSGSGKSTILSLIGGFDYPTRGEILFQGKDVKDLPAYQRPTSTIFQDYSLFPQLNVEENVKYGLKLVRKTIQEDQIKYSSVLKSKQALWKKTAEEKMKALDKEQEKYKLDIKNKKLSKKKRLKAQKWLDDSDFKYSYWENYNSLKTTKFQKSKTTRKLTKEEMNEIVLNMLDLVGLKDNLKSNIDSLSGGMKQRVALARSLAIEPKILLLDEPLSALDAKIRRKMQLLLANIQDELEKTFIFVTHDREEALELSDRVIVIKDGAIQQFDTPKNVYEHPSNKWVANFIGDANFFEGVILSDNKIKVDQFVFDLAQEYQHFSVGQNVDVLIRPEDIEVDLKNGFARGFVNDWTYKGSYYFTEAKVNDKSIYFETNKFYEYKTEIFLKWSDTALHLMQKQEV